MLLYLFCGGLAAGLIDSIAGGGGLITLPILMWALGSPAHAVGTNKIVGATGAFLALCVYLRKYNLHWKRAIPFLGAILVGSYLGSQITPHLNFNIFRGVLLALCPVILFFVWRKNTWIHVATKGTHQKLRHALIIEFSTGLACGIYDGAFGPGGGTFMLLGLLFISKLPLMEALILSKLANTLSASMAWLSYGLQGYVHLHEGTVMASGMAIGSVMGSQFASRKAEKAVRPALILAVLIFMIKMISDLWIAHKST